MILDGSTFPERHPIFRSTGGEPLQIDTLAAMLPKGCYKRLRNCKITHNNTVPLLLLPGGATIKKSLYSWLPISHPVRKLAIIIQNALRSKHFSAIRKAGVLTSTKAIYHVRSGYEYFLDLKVDVDAEAIVPLRLEAGCFVLLTNLSANKERVQWPAVTLLELYKNQSGIEQNFGFLKDPVIVNSIFLKKPNRIEVLGLILVIALLIWRLMERCMRQHLERTKSEISGWKNRPTKRPTSFMMTTKFLSILVARSGTQRQLVRPLKPVQLEFLQAMGVNPEVFVKP